MRNKRLFVFAVPIERWMLQCLILLPFFANIKLAGALSCLRCFGVPDACSRPTNSPGSSVTVEYCTPTQFWCKVSLYSWSTQYNVMMGCTEACRPSDPQTLCCQKDVCNCFGSNCYEQLTSSAASWYQQTSTARLSTFGMITTLRPPPPVPIIPTWRSSRPPTTSAELYYWPPWWGTSAQATYLPVAPSPTAPVLSAVNPPAYHQVASVGLPAKAYVYVVETTTARNKIDQCYECYDCGSKNQPTPAFCPPNRANYCVTAVVNFVGLRRIDRFCSDICPPRTAGYIQAQCCDHSTCNIGQASSTTTVNASLATVVTAAAIIVAAIIMQTSFVAQIFY